MKGMDLRTLLESQASKFAILNPALVYRFKDGAGVLGLKLRAMKRDLLRAVMTAIASIKNG
jgi:hypothetical protein